VASPADLLAECSRLLGRRPELELETAGAAGEGAAIVRGVLPLAVSGGKGSLGGLRGVAGVEQLLVLDVRLKVPLMLCAAPERGVDTSGGGGGATAHGCLGCLGVGTDLADLVDAEGVCRSTDAGRFCIKRSSSPLK